MKKLEIESIDKLLLSHLLTTEPFPPHLHIHNNALWTHDVLKPAMRTHFINNITYRLTPEICCYFVPMISMDFSVKDHGTMGIRSDPFYRGIYPDLPQHRITNIFWHASRIMSITTSPPICQRIRCGVWISCDSDLIEALNQKNSVTTFYAKAILSLILLSLQILGFCHKACTSGRYHPQAVKDAIQYVDQNLSNTLSIQDIADHLESGAVPSSVTCSRTFLPGPLRGTTSLPPGSSMPAPLQKGMSITDVCFECRFNDYAHFVKSFTKLVGISPGKYSKTLRGIPTPAKGSHAYF